ncbi:hypothetical protein [Chengkuizengella axinellae]|uniref:Uncharacterized protein n=1 Tax=Chengkuizengella axinellae TaxID=3064388 RepID=A0ABT9IYT6_9BACL|nr:hypothetical protein [Chengkuizengella sp. 2205SS18-9]MDP5274525.1 hypothetical protein [Chengkuizengella sp. 2205SS18-9]
MIKKYQIYKKDKWNMMNVEVNGRHIILREISDQWGEDTHDFLSRPALMDWVNKRFSAEQFEGTESERLEIIEKFQQI